MQKALRIAALVLAVMVVVVLAVAPVSAAPALQGGGGGSGSSGSSGSGSSNAGGAKAGGNNAGANGQAGMNNWQTLQPGQTVEWIFNYTGNTDNANVELSMNPANSVGFNVFSDNQWTTGDTATPLGKGTQRTTKDTSTGQNIISNNGDLFWSTSSSGGSQRFHIVVFSTSQQPAQYWINATGPGAGSLTAFNASASNTSLQGQSAQGTSSNAGASTSASTSRSTTGARSTTRSGTSNAGASQAPRTLPRTGGSDLAVLFAAAAAALIAGGWLARRRTN